MPCYSNSFDDENHNEVFERVQGKSSPSHCIDASLSIDDLLHLFTYFWICKFAVL